MSRNDSPLTSGGPLPLMFWGGVAVAPIAALMILFSSGTTGIRIAAVLAVLAVVMIGLAAMLRDSGPMQGELEEVVFSESDALRQDIREDIKAAVRVVHKAANEKLTIAYDELEALRAEVDGLHRAVEAAAQAAATAAEMAKNAAEATRPAVAAVTAAPAPVYSAPPEPVYSAPSSAPAEPQRDYSWSGQNTSDASYRDLYNNGTSWAERTGYIPAATDHNSGYTGSYGAASYSATSSYDPSSRDSFSRDRPSHGYVSRDDSARDTPLSDDNGRDPLDVSRTDGESTYAGPWTGEPEKTSRGYQWSVDAPDSYPERRFTDTYGGGRDSRR